MEFWLSLALFSAVATMTALIGVRMWARPKAALDRVTGAHTPVAWRIPSHPSLAFRNLATRLGAALPAPEKSAERLRLLLARAGHYHPQAVLVVQGSRVLLAAAMGLLGALLTSGRTVAASEKSFLILTAAVAGAILPGIFLNWQVRRRQRRIRRGLPDALDLLVICVESGLGLDQAIAQTAKELEAAHPDISREFAMVHLELKTGVRRQDALRNLGQRTGVSELKKLVAVLLQADRFGTSIAQSLRTHADFMRVQARQTAEEKVAKLGVKLVFPIFFCILPSLFVVTVGPVAVRMVRELLPRLNSL